MANSDSWREVDLLNLEHFREPEQSVYHYTNADGLLGILKTKQLWATEASGMNDVAETKQGWKFIEAWIQEQGCSSVAVREMARAYGDNERGPTGVFVLSASTREDDANQWRLYGNGARGYAVELDPTAGLGVGIGLASEKEFRREPDGASFDDPDGGGERAFTFSEVLARVPVTNWLHVLYDEEEKRQALVNLAKRAEVEFPKVRPDDGSLEELRVRLRQSLDILAKLMKGTGFSGESEVRRVVTEWPQVSGLSVAHYKESQYGVVRYAKLAADNRRIEKLWKRPLAKDELEETGRLPILSVTVGNLIRPENAIPTIEALLETYGYDAIVKASTVPLAW